MNRDSPKTVILNCNKISLFFLWKPVSATEKKKVIATFSSHKSDFFFFTELWDINL